MDVLPVTRTTVAVNGTRLYCEVCGSGQTVILVSGGGTLDRRMWDDQFALFARSHRVIRYDIRGIGQSARPDRPFSHADDLAALLRELKTGRVDVVGLSFGAAIAVDFALEHPDAVRRLVLASPGLSSDRAQHLQAVLGLSQLAREQGMSSVIELLVGHPTLLAAPSSASQQLLRTIYTDNADLFASDFPLIQLWIPVSPPAIERLSSIRVPSLVLTGDRDSEAVHTLAATLSQQLAASSMQMLPGAGHFVHLDAPDGFNQAVLAFIAP